MDVSLIDAFRLLLSLCAVSMSLSLSHSDCLPASQCPANYIPSVADQTFV